MKSLAVLQDVAGSLQNPGAVGESLHRLLASLVEMAGAESAGTVAAPDGVPIHLLEAGASAADLGVNVPMEVAA